MLGWIKGRLKALVEKAAAGDPARQLPQEELEGQPLVVNLDTNLERLKDILGESLDIVYREFRIGLKKEIRAAVIYLDAMVDKNRIQEFILRPLMVEARMAPPPGLALMKALDRIKENTLTMGDVKEALFLGEVVEGVLSGNTAILLAGES